MTFEIKDDPPCFRKPCVSGNTHFLKDKKKNIEFEICKIYTYDLRKEKKKKPDHLKREGVTAEILCMWSCCNS